MTLNPLDKYECMSCEEPRPGFAAPTPKANATSSILANNKPNANLFSQASAPAPTSTNIFATKSVDAGPWHPVKSVFT